MLIKVIPIKGKVKKSLQTKNLKKSPKREEMIRILQKINNLSNLMRKVKAKALISTLL